MTLVIREDDPAAAHVADLLAYHLSDLRSVMADFAFALDAGGLSSPGITFWTAWRGETLSGFVALKEHAADWGEVKSMRAAPSARGTGVGRALILHVIEQARARNYAWVMLETGTAELHAPAAALYHSVGFVDCDAFADYRPSAHNRFMSLALQEHPCRNSS